jgi:hypothetical protein
MILNKSKVKIYCRIFQSSIENIKRRKYWKIFSLKFLTLLQIIFSLLFHDFKNAIWEIYDTLDIHLLKYSFRIHYFSIKW